MSNWWDITKRRIPIIEWLPNYRFSHFLHDTLGGFTVALTEIPQSIAYASIAGLPLQYGLYSSFMGSFAYAIFGSCKVINMGATSLMALMIQPFVTKMGYDMSPFMTFFGGVLVLTMGLLRLGFIIDFFSYPVTAGFTSAAALTIASSQIKNLLGFSGKSYNQFLESWQSIMENVSHTSKYDAILGISSLIFLIVLRRIRVFGGLTYDSNLSRSRNIFRRFIFAITIAKNALIVIITASIAYVLDQKGKRPFKLTGHVDGGLPSIHPPPFSTNFNGTEYGFVDMIVGFGPSLGFIPLVAIIETIAIAKVFSDGKLIDGNQEMIALGIGNMLGSLFKSMPVTGSFTRTAINKSSGSKSTFSGVVTGCTVLIVIEFVTSSLYYIPSATLAGVIICAMIYLFEYEAFIMLWKNKKSDLIPLWVTFLTSLFISLEYGILIGIGVNLMFVLYATARPKLVIIEDKMSQCDNVYVFTPKTTIYFPAAQYLRDVVLECEGEGVTIIMDGKYIGNIDITVAKSLISVSHEATLRKQTMIFMNFKPMIRKICAGIDPNIDKHFIDAVEISDLKSDFMLLTLVSMES